MGQKTFLLGNEAIARGAVEAGVQVAAAYPGTPSSEILTALSKVANDLGIYVEWSANEKVAFEVALAGSISGLRSMASMKHVGVNVAHDAVITAGYLGAKGGLVLLSADDPNAWSSQNEQDNRWIARQAYLPVLEPSDIQESKDMMRDAFELSERFKHPFMYRSVTRIGHARGDIELGSVNKERRKGNFTKDPSNLSYVPTVARKNRPLMIKRFEEIKNAVNNLPFNKLSLSDKAERGIICSGISYAYSSEALKWLNLEDKLSILKIGTTYPIPEKLVEKLLNSVQEVLIVEELEPFVELHVKALAAEKNISVKIHGKDYVPLIGELTTGLVTQAIAKFAGVKTPLDFEKINTFSNNSVNLLPTRPPILCAGCPHRASFFAIKKAAEKVARENGTVPVYPGDIGCYSLGISAPLETIDTLICMGGSIGIANGLSHIIKSPIIPCIGDSTFFHSGMPALVNAVYNNAKMTIVVLDNKTTAMTGFQNHPGTGRIATGEPTNQIKIEEVVKGCGIKFIEVVDPYNSKKTIDIMTQALHFEGPSVVILRQQCSLEAVRSSKKRGDKITPYYIDLEKCSKCDACIKVFACPAILRKINEDNSFGDYYIDSASCTGCGVCVQICPYRAIMESE